MRTRCHKRNPSLSRSTHVFRNIASFIKKHFGEIVTGVVIGIIILIVTPFVNSAIESHSIRQKLVNDLSSISLGMSKNYIDGLFGQPIIESRYEEAVTWYSDYQTEEPFISAGYKLKNSVLLCLYCDNNLVAFAVVVNESHLYRIPANMFLDDCYLLDFTYFDFSETVEKCEGNVPANNDTYAYYSELYYGAGPANYNYFILGSYKDYREKTDAWALMHMGQAYALDVDDFYQYSKEEYDLARKNVQPNVFGVVSSTFSDEFNFVFQIVGNRVNGTLLFSDWIEY